jgi:hypothetical protein
MTNIQEEQDEIITRLGVIEFSHFMMTMSSIKVRQAIYQYVVPLRSMYYDQCRTAMDHIVCYSEHFRELAECEKIPTYKVTLNCDGFGVIIGVDFEEIKG